MNIGHQNRGNRFLPFQAQAAGGESLAELVVGERALMEAKWSGSKARFADGLPEDIVALAHEPTVRPPARPIAKLEIRRAEYGVLSLDQDGVADVTVGAGSL